VLNASSPPPIVLSEGICPSGWMPCSRQYSSQQALPTCVTADGSAPASSHPRTVKAWGGLCRLHKVRERHGELDSPRSGLADRPIRARSEGATAERLDTHSQSCRRTEHRQRGEGRSRPNCRVRKLTDAGRIGQRSVHVPGCRPGRCGWRSLRAWWLALTERKGGLITERRERGRAFCLAQ